MTSKCFERARRVSALALGLAACSIDDRDTQSLPESSSPLAPDGSSYATRPGDAGGTAEVARVMGGAPGVATAPEVVSDGSGEPAAPVAPAAPPSSLLSEEATLHFGSAELEQTGATLQWVVTYAPETALPSGPLSLTSSNEADFAITPGACSAGLQSGASCLIEVTFQPRAAGPRSGVLTLATESGASVSVELAGNAQLRVRVARSGAAAGTASVFTEGLDPAAPRAIECGTRCEALFDLGAQVTFEARTSNGSNSSFGGWSDPRCSGPRRRCTLTVESPFAIEARFPALLNDLVFVSSATYPTNLGSLAAYDAACNELANAAGLNTATGDGYVAAMASSTESLRDRLITGSAHGWVRMDGLPFTDDPTPLFDANRVYHPVRYDERGGAAEPYVLTGADNTGRTGPNCEDWTSTSETAVMFGGSSTAGPFLWAVSLAGNYCSQRWPILCFGMTRLTTIQRVTTSGKAIWLTNAPFVLGSMSPDQRCQLDRPAGVNAGIAFIAYDGQAGNEVLDPSATYVRPDGQVVGTGAEIAAGQLRSGIWQRGNGSYPDSVDSILAWTGPLDAAVSATANVTCNNWTSSSADDYAGRGLFGETTTSWYSGSSSCIENAYLYCIEP